MLYSDVLSCSLMSFFWSHPIPHSVYKRHLFRLLLAVTVCENFFIFEDFASVEQYSSGVLQNVPQLGSV